jgi:hypothetical protein
MNPMEHSHSVMIEISGSYNEVYGSKWFNDILNTELDHHILAERKKLLRKIKPLTDIFEKGWVGIVTLTVGDSYSEVFSYRLPSAAGTEVSFMFSDGQIQQTDVKITQCVNFELLDYTEKYLSNNSHKQTNGIAKAYGKVCKSIIGHYDNSSKIARVVDPAYHCYCITSNNRPLLVQSILTPAYRSDEVIEQSISPNKMTGF